MFFIGVSPLRNVAVTFVSSYLEDSFHLNRRTIYSLCTLKSIHRNSIATTHKDVNQKSFCKAYTQPQKTKPSFLYICRLKLKCSANKVF